MRASEFAGSFMSTFWKVPRASSYSSCSICAQPSSDSAWVSPGDSFRAFWSAWIAPAWSPSEMRLHPFSMKVEAPMWSACTAGRVPVNSGADASAAGGASCL